MHNKLVEFNVHPLLRKLLAHHEFSQSEETHIALEVLRQRLPQDEFSISQWAVGLDYYRERIAALNVAPKVCVDYGCGCGNWSIAAARIFDEVIGIDKNVERIVIAQEIAQRLNIHNVTFLHGNSIRMFPQLEKLSVSCVLAFNVLPFSLERLKILDSLCTLLKNNGRMLISFNEVGVLPYYFLSGLYSLDLNRLKEFALMIGYNFFHFMVRRTNQCEKTYGWINTNSFMQILRERKLIPVWCNWDSDIGESYKPLFPLRYLGFPFFQEVLVEKRKSC